MVDRHGSLDYPTLSAGLRLFCMGSIKCITSTCTKGMWLGTSRYIHLPMCYAFKDHMSYIQCKQLTILRSTCLIIRRCEKSFSLIPKTTCTHSEGIFGLSWSSKKATVFLRGFAYSKYQIAKLRFH
jgi:hypothetical protein